MNSSAVDHPRKIFLAHIGCDLIIRSPAQLDGQKHFVAVGVAMQRQCVSSGHHHELEQ